MESLRSASSSYERLLVQLDVNPAGAILRLALGFAVVPLWQRVAGPASGWLVFVWFVAVLVAMRIVPALLRKVVKFPPAVEDGWRYRRAVAKRFDSYQWRKLLSFGVGMIAYGVTVQRLDSWEIALAAANLVAGVLGEWAWRAGGKGMQVTGYRPGTGQLVSTDAPGKSDKPK
jgi:hypothetical protein